jgi:Protein of unknown function (DUF2934)
MPERLVDVEKQGAKVLHTFPVTISAPAVKDEAFKQKALEAAGNAKLVPNEELESLNAKMHVSRGGQLTPYGDPHGVLAETKAGLDQVVRERAYLLWEQAGRPDGCADEFWHQAQHQRFRERAYALWERAARKARRTSTGFRRAPLRRDEGSSVMKIKRLAGADRRRFLGQLQSNSWRAIARFQIGLDAHARAAAWL